MSKKTFAIKAIDIKTNDDNVINLFDDISSFTPDNNFLKNSFIVFVFLINMLFLCITIKEQQNDMTQERIYIKINFKDMNWTKMVSYDPNEETIESVVEDEQEGWVEFMESNDPNFDEDFKKNMETYNIEVYEMETL